MREGHEQVSQKRWPSAQRKGQKPMPMLRSASGAAARGALSEEFYLAVSLVSLVPVALTLRVEKRGRESVHFRRRTKRAIVVSKVWCTGLFCLASAVVV